MRLAALLLMVTVAVPMCGEQVDAVAMYNRASDLTGSLRVAGPRCVRMNMSVLIPAAGWQSGAVESCWAKNAVDGGSAAQHKNVSALKASLNLPGMHTTFLQRGQERMRWGDDGEMHFAVATVLDRVYSMYHKQAQPGEKLTLVRRHLHGEALLCASIGRVRYFCGDAATGAVRTVMVPGGEMEIVIDAVGQSDGVPYVRKATVLYFGKPVAMVEATELKRLSTSAIAEVFQPAPGARSALLDKAVRVDGALDWGQSLYAADHDRAARATLTVSTDGHARNVRVLAASDDGFAKEFSKALMKAHYSPATQSGVAVDSVVSAGVFFPGAEVRSTSQHARGDFNSPSETYLQSWQHATEERENGGTGISDWTFGHASLNFSPW